MKLLKERRSIRKFKQTPIDLDVLYDFIDCARLAPSAANMQPLKYIAENDPKINTEIFPLTKWAAYLKGAGTPGAGEEPTAYIVILCDTDIRKEGYELDTGAAAMSIITAAENQGISSCWILSVDKEAIARLYNLPENLKVVSLIALGYPAEKSKTVEYCGDIKYFKNDDGSLSVPKRALKDIIFNYQKNISKMY